MFAHQWVNKDSDSDFIYCLTNVYLAVLYYTTGQYQTAIDHCTLVTKSQDQSQCSSHVVQGELLPKIDDVIYSVLGSCVLPTRTKSCIKSPTDTTCRRVFVRLFAHYLHNICLSITQTSSNVEPCRLGNCIKNIQLLITDVLALKSVYRKFHYRPITV